MEYVIQLDLKPLYILFFACCDKQHAYVYSKIHAANNFAGNRCNISYERYHKTIKLKELVIILLFICTRFEFRFYPTINRDN